MFNDRRSKANQLLAWVVLVSVQAGVAALNWTWVMYDFAGQHKELLVSGYNVWPLASAQVLFGFAGFAVMSLTRNLARRVMGFVIAAISAAMAAFNLVSLPGAFANDVPAKVNAMVEKASGISGGATDGSSAAILFHTTAATLPLAFTVAAVLLALLQVSIAFRVSNWAKTEKRDKYERPQSKPASSAKNQKTGKPSKASKGKPEKGDNIALWDSQR